MLRAMQAFLKLEAASGILLFLAALLAIAAENSLAQALYERLLNTPVQVSVGDLKIAKPLLYWINDGLMAIFFFLIGLEIKREVVAGELSDPARVVLPIFGAAGGMFAPALIYSALNWNDPIAIQGWAIPSATDIAFALGVLSLLGSRVPSSLKLFLLTLAIIDDLGAILIIALFYTTNLSLQSLAIAAIAVVLLYTLNRKGVLNLTAYILLGLILWVAVLKSGVHATLAGVLTAFFIPFKAQPGEKHTQLERLEHDLHPTVAYFILPLFAFANAGISFESVTIQSFLHPVPLGIALGLFFGNQIGVMGFCWMAIRLKLAKMPDGVSWLQLYGVSMLCGIGFTMSLFISQLAFNESAGAIAIDERMGIMLGSLLSGVLGYAVLRFASRKWANR